MRTLSHGAARLPVPPRPQHHPHLRPLRLRTIRAKAISDGEERPVYVRVAQRGEAIYVDLANDDWEAIEIAPSGCTVVSDPPVKFTRTKNSAPFPYPTPGGSVDDLRRFLNVGEEHFKLIVGWLVGALKPQGPYPVLEVTGWQGTAKSTLTRLLVALADPAVVSLRALPANERDLAIAASGRWALAYDNVSYVKPEMSDAMCRLSTGGGIGTRKLYTDDEEKIFDAKRPQVVNGINPVVLRGDLQERSLQVLLTPISPDQRRQEREFWREFEEAMPSILGALLDAVSCALRKLDEVRLEEAPRMADFAAWVTAAEEALGWESGAFMEAYLANRKEASEAILENDIVGMAIKELLDNCPDGKWSTTSKKLLEKLKWLASEDNVRSKTWPKTPNHLSRHLNRIAPALKEAGIQYLQHEEGREKRKIKTLLKVGKAQSAGEVITDNEDCSEPSEGGSPAAVDADDFADDELEDPKEVVVNYLAELTKLGWHRAQTIFPQEDPGDEDTIDEDSVARQLHRKVGIYYGRRTQSFIYNADTTPWVVSAKELFDLEGEYKAEEQLRSAGWPATPEEMSTRLRRVIPLLQAKPQPFWDPGMAEWCDVREITYVGDEKLYKEAHLHAELWRNEETSEELWALVALQKGWRAPDEAIERAVWRRANRQSDVVETSDDKDDLDDDDFEF